MREGHYKNYVFSFSSIMHYLNAFLRVIFGCSRLYYCYCLNMSFIHGFCTLVAAHSIS